MNVFTKTSEFFSSCAIDVAAFPTIDNFSSFCAF